MSPTERNRLIRKAVWKAHRNGCVFVNAAHRLHWVHDSINTRAALRAAIARATEAGKVSVCRAGMDCDGTQYEEHRVIDVPVSIIAWQRAEGEHRQWLDGPERAWFERPSVAPDAYGAVDRALEAYENGHPSHIEWGDVPMELR